MIRHTDLLSLLATHCTWVQRGECARCDRRPDCGESLVPLVDQMLALAHDALAAERSRRRNRTSGDALELASLRRYVDALSLVVLDCGRTLPIHTIDQSLAAARGVSIPFPDSST